MPDQPPADDVPPEEGAPAEEAPADEAALAEEGAPAEDAAEAAPEGEAPAEEAPPDGEAAAEEAPADAGDAADAGPEDGAAPPEAAAEGGEEGDAGEAPADGEAPAETGGEESAEAPVEASQELGEASVEQPEGADGEAADGEAGDAGFGDSVDRAADEELPPGEESRGPSPTGASDALDDQNIDSAMVDGEGDFGDEPLEDEELEDDGTDPRQELQDKYEQLLELNERAMQSNVSLQRRAIQRKMQDKSFDTADKPAEGKVTEHKYQNVLYNVHSVRLRLRLQQVKAARMSEELKSQLEAKRQKAIECRDSFQEFKRQVARHAEYARTGKKIPEKIIQEVEEFELDKDAEVEEVRGSNISLKNRLAKLEQALRKKDELAENLHVIDFEQLKIENQTLNEKIEERNEELHKLRKKTIVTVQIITHMREKVQFVQQEYQALKAELAQLDSDLTAQRDLVAKTKHERDDYRSDNSKFRQQTGLVNSDNLTKDFEQRKETVKQMKDDIANLKKRHGQMLQFLKQHGQSV